MHPVSAARSARLLALTLAASIGLLLTGAGPATAHGDRDRLESIVREHGTDGGASLLTSDTVEPQSSNPSQLGISGCFLATAPLFVTSGLESVRVMDVSDGTRPELVGALPSAQFENEAMSCGERRTRDGIRRFALIGVDLYQASAGDIEHVNAGGGELVVVEVTDPEHPEIVSRTPGSTSTHTVACVDETDCRYAYSAGSGGAFSIFDLRDLDDPLEIDAKPGEPGLQAFSSPTAGHKWNFDEAGFGAHTGFGGTSMWSIDDPRRPELITTTGAAGRGEDPAAEGYNDFIHHNSYRPHARRFEPGTEPSIEHGNVLLITEEDYEETDCSKAGSFQTWWVKRLDGSPDAIVPLDKVELSDLGSYPLPRGAFCSAHWFDQRDDGLVSIGYYGGGMHVLDVRDARHIKAYGHAVEGASEVWDAMWLPVYDKHGKRTGRKSNVVYAIDLVRGLDVYAVDVPGDGRGAEPDPAVYPRESGRTAASVVLPLGLVGAAALTAAGARRRRRTA